MSIAPGLEDQQLLEDTIRRARGRMTARERLAFACTNTGLAMAVALLWVISPSHGLEVWPAVICTALLALSTLVRFETPLGFTVPTQLAFVPLLFAVPASLVPVATVIALVIGRLPDVVGGKLRPSRLLQVPSNAWFSVGPAAVFAVAGVSPRSAGPALLLAALAAQFVCDFAFSVLRDAIGRGVDLSQQLGEFWVYAVDAALSGVGYAVAKNIHSAPASVLVLVPLLGLFAVFARERHHRLQSLLELNSAYRGTALVLGDVVEADDTYTGAHSKGVVELSLAVGDRLGLSAAQRRNLEFAALLHDVGKIAISKEIINKPGKLEPHEWTVIKTHTIEGQKLLDRVGGFMREVGLIVRSHHERWDGRGYPDGLAGTEIPLESRIICCCDAWNAMRTDRAYRAALQHDEAVAELRASAGSQLDREIVDTLLSIVETSGPPGSDAALFDPIARRSESQSGEASSASTDQEPTLDDVRASDPVGRLLEDSWHSRSERAGSRELMVEIAASALFLLIAVPWAMPTLAGGDLPLLLTLSLVGLYAAARTVKFPIGAGSLVPSYLVLVPMLLLLPPNTVPLLTAVALVLGAGWRVLRKQGTADELLFSVPDAWHTLGPAVVLALTSPVSGVSRVAVYVAALLAGLLLDLIVSTLRESLAEGVAPRLQGRVIAFVWLVDACIAPLGLLVAKASQANRAALLIVIPVLALLRLVDRDRKARIVEAQHRLDVVARERTRLQAAVHRLGDALAARLDLRALTNVLLEGSIDALDADAGRLLMTPPIGLELLEGSAATELDRLLRRASDAALAHGEPHSMQRDGVSVIALPFRFEGEGAGTLAVARRGREFRDDERTLLLGLVDRGQRVVNEIVAHEALRDQAMTDPLTRLGNRRKLAADLAPRVGADSSEPVLLMLFDLDGFKTYNDTFGHVAGDVLLARLGNKLASAVGADGSAYRLGGDEFCVILPVAPEALHAAVTTVAGALEEHGEKFTVTASCGTVLLPHEATSVEYALQLADERMYSHKQGRPSGAREQAHDVLIHIMRAKQPALAEHPDGIARLAVGVGRRLGMQGEQLDELSRAAALHDVGKVGVPDAILTKPGPLDAEEWDFVRQHTLLGERILSAAPALRPVATIVRATHERWDGRGYPDGLRGEEIPLGARIVAVCDAYEAMTTERCYRPARSDELAREELAKEAGRQFDPAVVDAFLAELDHPTSLTFHDEDTSFAEARAVLASQVVSHVNDLLLSVDQGG